MTYSFTTRPGQGARALIPTRYNLSGYTLSVEYDDNSNFNSLVTGYGTVTYANNRITLELSASDVDTLQDTFFRIKAVGDLNFYVTDGYINYVPLTSEEITSDLIDSNGYIKNSYLPPVNTAIFDENVSAVVEDTNSNTSTVLRAAFDAKKKISTPQPFNTVSRNLTGALHSVVGVDNVRGQLIAWDKNNANYALSDDWGATWKNLAGVPANVINTQAYYKAVRFGSNIYAIHVDATDGLLGVYKAPSAAAATGALSWSTRLVTMSPNLGPGVTGISTAFNAGQTSMCLGDYGDFAAGPKIQRTTDGTTWTTVYGPDSTSRHVHAVIEDPYHPGTWYALLGDTGNTKTMLRSTDDAQTWSTIIPATNLNQWSGVQISFDANFIYVASDRPGLTAWYMDRTELVPRSVSTNWHYNHPVPGGRSGRVITDLATTSGSGTVTSASSSFTALDKGLQLIQVSQFKQGTFVAGVTNGTTLALSNDVTTGGGNAASTATGQTAYLGGDRFYAIAFMGAVDPSTGVFYSVPIDTSFKGNTNGIFYCPQIGGQFELIDSAPSTFGMDAAEVFFGGGKVWIGRNVFPALTF